MIFTPFLEHEYRKSSADPKCAGVTTPTFRCSDCGQYRGVYGRKRKGNNWVCKQCVNEDAQLIKDAK